MTFPPVTVTEQNIARLVAAGRLTSPARFQNSTYIALRVSGTGVAYRAGVVGEYVWRDPAVWLSESMVERCGAGVPILLNHPAEKVLDREGVEFKRRAVGSLIFAYVRGNELWGVARIFSADAAAIMETATLNTSPSVTFSGKQTFVKVGKGRLHLEGEPSSIDHVAICLRGVWDRDGQPGVENERAEQAG